MIDVTKPLQEPIRRDFFENVLNKKPLKKDEDDLLKLNPDELRGLMGDKGAEAFGGRLGGGDAGGLDTCERGQLDLGKEDRPWWYEKDELGKVKTPAFEEGDIYRKIAVAPFYLIYYTVKSFERRSRQDLKKYTNTLFKVCGVIFLISLIMTYYEPLEFLISFKSLAVLAGCMAGLCRLVFMSIGDEDERKSIDFGAEEGEKVLEDRCKKDDSLGVGFGLGLRERFDDADDDEDREKNYNNINKILKEYSESLPFEENVVEKGLSIDRYKDMLLRAFKRAEKARGSAKGWSRKDIIMSFRDYIFCTTPEFYNMYEVKRGSVVYNNVSYLIYDGLTRIFDKLDYSGQYGFIIEEFVENKVFYKVEAVLPKFITASKINSELGILMSKFKAHEADNDVRIRVDSYGDKIVFKIIKETEQIISWGDVIRFYDPRPMIDDKVFERFVSDKYDVPVLLGLQNDETPYIFDIAENTSIAIAGTSGSGKSWSVFLLMFNFFVQFHPGDVSFIILDHKRSAEYSTLARFPHVLGLHNNIDEFIDLMKEVVAEQERRKVILNRLEIDKWSELRRQLKDDPENLRRFPWLFIVVEETAAVLSQLEMDSKQKEKRDEFVGLLKQIAKQGRNVGMRLIMVSQRTVDRELPRDVMSECGVKIGFKLNEDDLRRLEIYNKDIANIEGRGIAAFKDMFLTDAISVKTLGIGGHNGLEMQNLLRMMAFDWHLRLSDKEAYANFRALDMLDNRRGRREKVLDDLKNGRYFTVDLKNEDVGAIVDEVDRDWVEDRGGTFDKEDVLEDVEKRMPEVKAGKGVGSTSVCTDGIKKDSEKSVGKGFGFMGAEFYKEEGVKEEKRPCGEDGQESKGDEGDIKGDERGYRRVNMRIPDFIYRYGEGENRNLIKKEVLRRYYSENEIERALVYSIITSLDDEYYMA